MRLTLAGAIVATMFATGTASAGPVTGARGGVDWARVMLDVDAVARQGAAVLDRPRCSPAGCQTDTNATAARPERDTLRHTQDRATDWFGMEPRLALVVRDWGSSFHVAGDRLALVDALRLTSSTRMVLTRVRVSNARVAPFAQVGLGQWRTDPYILPLTPRYVEIAAQAAAGVEVRVLGTWFVGVEQTFTMLHRERGDSNLPSAHMWSSSIASRVDF